MLIGREVEQARLLRLLGDARGGTSGALLLLGDAGVGKSELCRDAIANARGMHVLVARGLEAEAEYPFGILGDVLRPLIDTFATLPEPQSDALRAALALAPPSAVPTPFAVPVATLGVLAAAAEPRPLLILVDPLPTGPTIERAFRRRLEALDDDTRAALVVTAASASRDVALVVRALEQ